MSLRRDSGVNWVRRFGETGSVAPGQMGGRKPKAIAGEYAAFLARRVRDGAFTLRGLVAELAARVPGTKGIRQLRALVGAMAIYRNWFEAVIRPHLA